MSVFERKQIEYLTLNYFYNKIERFNIHSTISKSNQIILTYMLFRKVKKKKYRII